MSEGQSAGQVSVDIGTVIRPDFDAGLSKAEQRVNEFGARTEQARNQVNDLGDSAEHSSNRVHAGFTRAHLAGLHLSAGLGIVGAGFLLASQAATHISDALRVSGDEAYTFEGRIRNAGAEVLHGDLIGGILALTTADKRFSLSHLLEQTGVGAEQLRDFADNANSAATAADSVAKVRPGFAGIASASRDTAQAFNNEATEARALADELDRAGAEMDAFARASERAANAQPLTGGDVGRLSDAGVTRNQIREAVAQRTPGLSDDIAQAREEEAQAKRLFDVNKGISDGYLDREKALAVARTNRIKLEQEAAKKPKGPEAPIVPYALSSALAAAQLTTQTTDDLQKLKVIDNYLSQRIPVEKDANRKLQELEQLGQVRTQIATLSKTGLTLGTLFSGPYLGSEEFQTAQRFGYKARATDVLRDLREQIDRFKKFSADLTLIKRKGGSPELIAQLVAVGVDAFDEVDALAHSGLVDDYQRAFAQAQNPPALTDTGTKPATTASRSLYALTGKNPGLVKAGNIDLLHRPKVKNKDGSYSTVESVSFTSDGKEVLVPEVIPDRKKGGYKVGSAAEAWAEYQRTGKNLGTFASAATADAYADRLHLQQAGYYGGGAGDRTVQNITINVNSKSEADGVKKGLRQANFAAAAHAR